MPRTSSQFPPLRYYSPRDCHCVHLQGRRFYLPHDPEEAQNTGTLGLGWGLKPAWQQSCTEPKATGAPTVFGRENVSFALRDGLFHCAFARGAAGHPDPERIRLRLPADRVLLRSVRFNDRDLAVSTKQTSLDCSL